MYITSRVFSVKVVFSWRGFGKGVRGFLSDFREEDVLVSTSVLSNLKVVPGKRVCIERSEVEKVDVVGLQLVGGNPTDFLLKLYKRSLQKFFFLPRLLRVGEVLGIPLTTPLSSVEELSNLPPLGEVRNAKFWIPKKKDPVYDFAFAEVIYFKVVKGSGIVLPTSQVVLEGGSVENCLGIPYFLYHIKNTTPYVTYAQTKIGVSPHLEKERKKLLNFLQRRYNKKRNGSCLLVGGRDSGKRVLVRETCMVSGFHCYEVNCAIPEEFASIDEDLTTILETHRKFGPTVRFPFL